MNIQAGPTSSHLSKFSVDFSRHEELKLQFLELLEEEIPSSPDKRKYRDVLEKVLEKGEHRLNIDLNDIRELDPDLASNLTRDPLHYLHSLECAVNEMVGQIDPSSAKQLKYNAIRVAFTGSFGRNHISPRGLNSTLLSQLVSVEGIVTKCSLVRPKMVKAVMLNSKNKEHVEQNFKDYSDICIGHETYSGSDKPHLPTDVLMSNKDEEGNELKTEFGLCVFKDYQVITIQEMPERAALGQLPRSVDVELSYDLVDKVKPGDRIQCVGVFKAMPNNSQQGSKNGTNGHFPTKILCNNIRILAELDTSMQMSGEDIASIRALSKNEDLLSLMASSIAPSIYGHEKIKKSLVLQALGGVGKTLENRTQLRGDINILMVGDPSTAKSQLLRAMMGINQVAVNTTGRGSSGVGLTAAVVSDSETGERRLEAGAMVLADRGVVCIDEFDKMSEADRVAIHEVMEQQTVTIAKAGIHASLNARCSVLAAANPVYGQYNKHKRAQENIGLPDSLLSRFDFLFVVLDTLDPEIDRHIAEHVLKAHSYRKPGSDGTPEPLTGGPLDLLLQEGEKENEDSSNSKGIWQRHNYASSKPGGKTNGRRGNEILTKKFVKKYIRYAKQKIEPVLTEAANEYIADAYAQLRSKQDIKTVPITPRTLETLIRLSTAHAKLRLSKTVEEMDCEQAMDLLSYALYHEGDLMNNRGKQNQPQNDLEVDGETDEEINSSQENINRENIKSNNKSRRELSDTSFHSTKRGRANDGSVLKGNAEEEELIGEVIAELALEYDMEVPKDALMEECQRRLGDSFQDKQLDTMLHTLASKNKIMIDSETNTIQTL